MTSPTSGVWRLPVRGHEIGLNASGVLNHIPAAVIVFGPDGEVQLVNRHGKCLLEGMGLEMSQFKGLGLRGFTRVQPQWSPLLAVLDNGTEWRNPAMEVNIDGEKQVFDVVATPVLENAKTIYVSCIAWPLSNKSIEDLLREKERLAITAKLSADAAHEIRNTMTVIRGFLQLMKMQAQPNPEHLRIAIAEIDRIEVLLQGLLMVARPIAPRQNPTDLNQLISQVILLTQARARQKGIELVADLDPAVPTVSVDAGQIRQALFNLILNSKEAMYDGGQILLETRYEVDRRCVVIRVVDTGPGMDPEQLSQVLNPFYTTKEGGTGLGLPMVNSIVRNHGGEFHLHSEPGRGTTATIRLPVDGLSLH